jgi:hypothetical protein
VAFLIGLDFDNTIAMYDDVAETVAVELGMTTPRSGSKIKELRDELRRLPGGDDNWQLVQAAIYGPRIGEASIAPGVEEFLQKCAIQNQRVVIVSHKTQYASKGGRSTDLRQSALSWMRDHELFGVGGLGVEESDVHFEPTRQEKVDRIRSLGCTHFIDDLPEVFVDPGFPSDVEKLLYAPGVQLDAGEEAHSFRSWREITEHFFQD